MGFRPFENLNVLPWMWALVISLIWAGLVFFRVQREPSHYQTVDGYYYQDLANRFLTGKPMVLPDLVNEKGFSFSPYPPGYPVLLGLSSPLLAIPFHQATIVLHGFMVFLLLGFGWKSGWGPALVLLFFSDTTIELGGHTWSEFSFLFFGVCLGLMWKPQTDSKGMSPGWIWALMGGAAFFMRYAAVCWIPVFFISFLWNREKSRSGVQLLAGTIFLLVASGWFWYQWKITGLPTGGDRYPNQDSAIYLLKSLMQEAMFQVFLLRNPDGTRPWWELLAALFQLGIFFYFFLWKGLFQNWKQRFFSNSFLVLGCFYLAGMVVIRWWYYFAESYDFRLLGPGFILIGIGIFGQEIRFRPGRNQAAFILVWVLVSLLFFMPKNPIFFTVFH